MRGNSVSIKGNLTRDAEVRRTPSGSLSVAFGVAWNQSRKNQQGGFDDVPHYFDVQMWVTDKQLNYLQPQLVQGARCAIVDGHLEYQSWQDKQGNKRSKVVIRVDDPINGLLVQHQGAQSGYNGGQQQQYNNYPPQQQNGGYSAPQPPQNGGQQLPNNYQGQQMADTSVYDSGIPF